MTDVERLWRPSTPRPSRGLRHSRWTVSTLAVVAVFSSTVTISSRPVSATSLTDARHQAAVIYGQIQDANRQVGRLEGKAVQAQDQLSHVRNQIANTQQIVAEASRKVAVDRKQLKSAAFNAFVNNGAAASSNPLFSGNENTIGAANLYRQLAEGNLTNSVANLRNSNLILTSERQILRAQLGEAAAASRVASSAFRQARGIVAHLESIQRNISSQITSILSANAAAAAARAMADRKSVV